MLHVYGGMYVLRLYTNSVLVNEPAYRQTKRYRIAESELFTVKKINLPISLGLPLV